MKPLPQEDLAAAIDLAEDCFRSLRGARMFLTGCTGFFGVWLLETFRRADERLASLRLQDGLHPRIETVAHCWTDETWAVIDGFLRPRLASPNGSP